MEKPCHILQNWKPHFNIHLNRSLLCTILRYPFLADYPKIFLKAPWVPIYTNLRGERAPKKRNFWSKLQKKAQKHAFLGLFFQKLACVAQKFGQTGGLYSDLGELRKSFWST